MAQSPSPGLSRADLRRLALIAGAAFIFRLGVALLTETHPLFPDYYYTDARLIDSAALAVAEGGAGGKIGVPTGSASQTFQIGVQAAIYSIVGPHPFVMKLLACALGAAGVAALAAAAAAALGPWPALATAALCALWPSNAFYTSQNFKEAPTNLFAYLTLALLLPFAVPRAGGARSPRAAAGAACLILTGFYRPYVMLVLALALAAALLAAGASRRASRGRQALGLAAVLGGVAAFLPVSRFVSARVLPAAMTADPRVQPELIPVTYDGKTERAFAPTSPRALDEFRRLRQGYDREWARKRMGREIGTQIYPTARFESWSDVLLFLPKAAGTVLFMPLPGLYPLDGKLGRLLAALENSLLLALACLGMIGAARGPKTPARLAFLLVFFGMTAGSALLEFDLGSAGRHKLFYLPLLFPFAAEEALRWIRSGKDASRPIW